MLDHKSLSRSRRSLSSLALLAALSAQCGGVSNAEAARKAYVGLDRAVDRALSLAFDGFNAATSANIPAQTGNGDVMGTMLVEGQVSQGSSSNREMRLRVTLTNYRDTVRDNGDGGTGAELRLIYDMPQGGTPLTFDLSLRPPTFTGTMTGTLRMTGEIEGTVTLNLMMSGQLESMSGMGSRLMRVAGSTRIQGTVTSGSTTFNVDVMR
ncbi:MAG: hypothetical protein JNK05_07645 [Myxococcales bacterium]|nr:hypothetical protein [Myxococcales bacterium]